MFEIGARVEIKPLFDRFGEEVDDLGRRVAFIVDYLGDDDYRIQMKGTGEVWDIWVGRLRKY